MEKPNVEDSRHRGLITGLLIAVLLLALPVAVWLDLTNLAEAALRRQASDLNSVITSVRGYYATNVVGRVLANPGSTQVVHNYEAIPGAIPIPATLSLELGRVIGAQQENIRYRFVSDFPFKNRTPHQLDEFEKSSLESLRNDPNQKIVDTSASVFSDSVRLIAPVIMGTACVGCHNIHPESPKRDWKVGDVRGIQEVAITQPIAANLFSFKFLFAYFVLVALSGISFLGMQRRQAMRIKGMNRELESANDFLASLSMKISRYISPQVYSELYCNDRAATAGTDHPTSQRVFYGNVRNCSRAWGHDRQILATQC
jgi:adenylate cyclase